MMYLVEIKDACDFGKIAMRRLFADRADAEAFGTNQCYWHNEKDKEYQGWEYEITEIKIGDQADVYAHNQTERANA